MVVNGKIDRPAAYLRKSNAAISSMLRISRMRSLMAGWFHVLPSMAGKTRDLLVRRRVGAHERKLALFREDDQVAVGEHDLAVAVTAALPFQIARLPLQIS